ncbi:hypothetical protein SDC9_164506 [bioreactor metagenome]|uniref:Uncharacterized protein n=1 Tax=bioreactor metagenome TaxID=1076179 RepID=A0A645FTU1_9ZZZZ
MAVLRGVLAVFGDRIGCCRPCDPVHRRVESQAAPGGAAENQRTSSGKRTDQRHHPFDPGRRDRDRYPGQNHADQSGRPVPDRLGRRRAGPARVPGASPGGRSDRGSGHFSHRAGAEYRRGSDSASRGGAQPSG